MHHGYQLPERQRVPRLGSVVSGISQTRCIAVAAESEINLRGNYEALKR